MLTMTGRKPTCAQCGTPLGNTVFECHDCGGSDVSGHYGELSAVEGTTVGDDVTYRGGKRNVPFGNLVR